MGFIVFILFGLIVGFVARALLPGRQSMGVAEGREWEPLEGVGANARPSVEAVIEKERV